MEAKRVTANGISGRTYRPSMGAARVILARPGRVLSKDDIAQHLLSYDEHLALNTIEVYVLRLRAKIEPAGGRIRTVPRARLFVGASQCLTLGSPWRAQHPAPPSFDS